MMQVSVLHVCMCVHVCMCACVCYVCACAHVHMHACVHPCMHVRRSLGGHLREGCAAAAARAVASSGITAAACAGGSTPSEGKGTSLYGSTPSEGKGTSLYISRRASGRAQTAAKTTRTIPCWRQLRRPCISCAKLVTGSRCNRPLHLCIA